MKQLTILLFTTLTLLIQGCGFVEETICEETEGQVRNGLIYLPNQQEPFTGNNLCKYENGKKKNEGKFKDGKKDGKWTLWNEKGHKREEGNYKDGKKEGKWTDWIFWNGQKQSEVNYKDGKQDGKWTWWWENGQIKSDGNYKDDKKDGKWTSWSSNGQIKSEGNYKDGKKDGKWTGYSNGQIGEEGNYKDGKEDGKWTWWWENGQKGGEGKFKDGKKDGKWTEWYENGQITSEGNYKDGKKDGEWIDGDGKVVGNYKDDIAERDPLGKDIQHLLDSTMKIRKLRISTNGIPGTIEIDEDHYLVQGTLSTQWTRRGVSAALAIKGIRADRGTAIVQLDVSPGSNAAFEDLLPIISLNSAVVLIDDEGHKYEPIGYYLGDDRRMQLTLTPSTPIRYMSELPMHLLTSSNNKTLTLIFQVTEGVHLKEFRVGDHTIGTCSLVAERNKR